MCVVVKLWPCLVLRVKKKKLFDFLNFVGVENTEETTLDCSLFKTEFKKTFKY